MSAAELPTIEQTSRVRMLLEHVPRDASKRRVGPLCVRGLRRGKEEWLVGYAWTRAPGTPTRDQIEHTILGHGDKLDDAVAMMQKRLGVDSHALQGS